MIISLWFICTLSVIIISSCLLTFLWINKASFFSLRWQDFKEELKGNLFLPRKYRCPLELWKWETTDDESVCEDCLERANWPPMDIADWMKEGLPGTPEAHTHCKEHCRCELVLHHEPQRPPNPFI